MSGLNLSRERALALFFFAVVAFSPALLSIFSKPAFLFGVPVLYLYLFGIWGLIIAFIGLNAFPVERDSPWPVSDQPSQTELLGGGRDEDL